MGSVRDFIKTCVLGLFFSAVFWTVYLLQHQFFTDTRSPLPHPPYLSVLSSNNNVTPHSNSVTSYLHDILLAAMVGN